MSLLNTFYKRNMRLAFKQITKKIQFITNYMKEHIDKVVTVSSLAEKVGMSDKSFAYMFSKTIGISPKKYLMSLKVKKKLKDYYLGLTSKLLKLQS